MRFRECAASPVQATRARSRARLAAARCPIRPARRANRSCALQRVADASAGTLCAYEPEIRFVGGALDEEREAHGFEAALRFECVEAHIALRVRASALFNFVQYSGRISLVEHRRAPHF